MMEDLIIRYFHFIGIMGLTSALVAEHLLLKPSMAVQDIRRIAIVDGIYGLSSIITLVMGLLLWFVVGKPADFYSANWVFHAKFSLFVLVALLSIYPTLFFLKHRKGDSAHVVQIPKAIIMIIRLELLLLFLIPMLGVLIANGVGLK